MVVRLGDRRAPLALVLLWLGCSPGAGSGGASSSASTAGSGGASTSASTASSGGASSSASTSGSGGGGEPPKATPSGLLLLTAERLSALEADAAANAPRFQKLKALVDSHAGTTPDVWHDSPENAALLYLLTKEPNYAALAFSWEKTILETANVRFDSYLEFGDLMRHAAIVLDWCRPALDASERALLANYLETWTEELWFNNQGSGWGLEDPGNNYHHAFLQGTAYAGYALVNEGRAAGSKFLAKLDHHLHRAGGVLDYLSSKVGGGDWREGTNYGERSKQRLFDTLAVVASMGGTNHFHTHPFFAESVEFALHQLQPDRATLAPTGDLACDSAMPVTASERDYLHSAGAWLGDEKARQLARFYLDEVAPPYTNPYAGLAFKELVFDVSGPALDPAGLPLSYHAEGTGFVNWRSGWDEGATSVTLSSASELEQSHQHHDIGSFVIWKRGWLAMDATTLSKTGLSWEPGAHNTIHVEGTERRMGPSGGLTRLDDRGAFAYAATDATPQHRRKTNGPDEWLMNEVSRELVYVRPSTLVVYDRVRPKDPSRFVEWRLHVPQPPSLGAAVMVNVGAAGLTLLPVVPNVVGLSSDGDLDGGASTAWRVTEASAGSQSRFLNVIAVADGGPPLLEATHVVSSGVMEGVAFGSFVVLFSGSDFGASGQLPFTYTVPGTVERTHVLANMPSAVDVTTSVVAGNVVVSVSKGSAVPLASSGLVTFKK